MAAGRCSGCGRTDSQRKISQHVVDCQAYIDLFQHHPERCLDPAAEFQRYQAEENNVVARAEQRGTRMSARFAEINQQYAVSAARWRRPPDILE